MTNDDFYTEMLANNPEIREYVNWENQVIYHYEVDACGNLLVEHCWYPDGTYEWRENKRRDNMHTPEEFRER